MTIKKIFSLVIVAIMTSATVGLKAQNLNQNQQQQQEIEVSDSALQTFAEIMREAQAVQKQSQGVMMKAIEENDLGMKRFQEISQAKRQGEDIEMTEEEEEAYASIEQVMQEEQQKMKEKMSSIIQEYSMDEQRYMEINRALR
ncbi:MAG: hypothetical protein ACQER7_02810, partial [Bacteroidota bacterium]